MDFAIAKNPNRPDDVYANSTNYNPKRDRKPTDPIPGKFASMKHVNESLNKHKHVDKLKVEIMAINKQLDELKDDNFAEHDMV